MTLTCRSKFIVPLEKPIAFFTSVGLITNDAAEETIFCSSRPPIVILAQVTVLSRTGIPDEA